MFSFDMYGIGPGHYLTPFNEVVNSTNITWGRLDQQVYLPVVIDGSARDAGNTSYTDVLRPGLLLGKVTSGTDKGKMMQWNPSATDGSQKIAGVLMSAQKMQLLGSDQDRYTGYVLLSGCVKANGLVIPSLTTDGIVGASLEWVVRRQMAYAFRFDDDVSSYIPGSVVSTVTADTTVTEAMAGQMFVTNGAASITFTLPASPKQGLEYSFFNAVDQNMVITCATTDIMICYNDIAADSVALSTAAEKVGGSFRVIGTGTKWIVIPNLWEAQTPTIAT
jgi:hypothetical protein